MNRSSTARLFLSSPGNSYSVYCRPLHFSFAMAGDSLKRFVLRRVYRPLLVFVVAMGGVYFHVYKTTRAQQYQAQCYKGLCCGWSGQKLTPPKTKARIWSVMFDTITTPTLPLSWVNSQIQVILFIFCVRVCGWTLWRWQWYLWWIYLCSLLSEMLMPEVKIAERALCGGE